MIDYLAVIVEYIGEVGTFSSDRKILFHSGPAWQCAPALALLHPPFEGKYEKLVVIL